MSSKIVDPEVQEEAVQEQVKQSIVFCACSYFDPIFFLRVSKSRVMAHAGLLMTAKS